MRGQVHKEVFPVKLRIIISLGIVLLLILSGLVLAKFTGGDAKEAYTDGNLIRLHVVANSNSVRDQEVKLEVRDAILASTRELFKDAKNGDEARSIILANLNYIESVAEDTLRAKGIYDRAKAEYGCFPFPVRTYGELTLPEGDYRALKVVIGEGKGENWWCVLFPPLCFNEEVGGTEIGPGEVEAVSGGRLVLRLSNLHEGLEEDVVEGRSIVDGDRIEFRFKSRSSRRFFELLSTPISHLYNLFRGE